MLNNIKEEKSLAKTISFIKDSTRISPKSSCEDVDTLNYKEKSGSLVIDYSYQRNFIQTLESASAYIESIFLGLIIPEIQVFEDYNTGRREIIDGQQRVLSLLKFYRDEYPLTKLKEFPELNGLYFKDLPNELKAVIRNFQVNVRTFTNEDELYKYAMFERLNTGAKKLNSQEVRNCVYRGKMLSTVKEISEEESVVKLFKSVKNNRFERDEQILNIMSLMYFLNNNKETDLKVPNSMKKRINEFLELAKNFSDEEIENIKERFLSLTEFISRCINLDEVLNLMYDGCIGFTVSKVIYESLFVSLDKFDLDICEANIDRLRNTFYKVFCSCEYKYSLGTGTSRTYSMILSRNRLMLNAIESVVKGI